MLRVPSADMVMWQLLEGLKDMLEVKGQNSETTRPAMPRDETVVEQVRALLVHACTDLRLHHLVRFTPWRFDVLGGHCPVRLESNDCTVFSWVCTLLQMDDVVHIYAAHEAAD